MRFVIIVLHYLTNKDDSKFWKDLNNREIPSTLKEKINIWKSKIPDENDFKDTRILFNHFNYILVMYGLDLLNVDVIKTKVNSLNQNLQDEINKIIQDRKLHFRSMSTLGHKEFLTKIREM